MDNIYTSTLKQKEKLNKGDSEKNTHHIVLSAEEIVYQPGDILQVYPENSDELVEKTIKFIKNGEHLKEKLKKEYDLSRISKKLVQKLAENTKKAEKELLEKILSPVSIVAFKKFSLDNDVPTLLEKIGMIEEDELDLIDKMSPRSYSIASCQSAFPDEIHLTVALSTFHKGKRKGMASCFLLENAQVGDKIRVSYKPHLNFRLPSGDANVIMIGPGTGIAPFIGFIQERLLRNNRGLNWLYFGERREREDFYYKDFLKRLEKDRFIRLDTAFSRDQEEKLYVQDRIEENKEDFLKYIERGYLYVCGDAKKMARSVDKMILKLLTEKHGEEKAREIIDEMKLSGRYRQDVY